LYLYKIGDRFVFENLKIYILRGADLYVRNLHFCTVGEPVTFATIAV
jgi:hypothetical protein